MEDLVLKAKEAADAEKRANHSRAAKARWANASPEQRAEWRRKISEGRKARVRQENDPLVSRSELLVLRERFEYLRKAFDVPDVEALKIQLRAAEDALRVKDAKIAELESKVADVRKFEEIKAILANGVTGARS
jgi:hypothetical protein